MFNANVDPVYLQWHGEESGCTADTLETPAASTFKWKSWSYNSLENCKKNLKNVSNAVNFHMVPPTKTRPQFQDMFKIVQHLKHNKGIQRNLTSIIVFL
jgi:hypothetical protein